MLLGLQSIDEILAEQVCWNCDDESVNFRCGRNLFFSDERLAFSAFGGILFGYDTGVISGIKEIPAWLKQFGFATTDLTRHPSGYMISSSTESLVVSILSAGTFFGALMAAPAAGEFYPSLHTTATHQTS